MKLKQELIKKFAGTHIQGLTLNNERLLMGKVEDLWKWIVKNFEPKHGRN